MTNKYVYKETDFIQPSPILNWGAKGHREPKVTCNSQGFLQDRISENGIQKVN